MRPDPARRRLLFGRAAPGRLPPWTVEAEIFERCRRCDSCAQACPEGILRRGDGGFPMVDFTAGACTFCGECARACPEPGLFDTASAPWRLSPIVGEDCLTGAGVMCRSCGDACPEHAIRFPPALRRAPLPQPVAERCTGCGACVAACPAGAVTLGAP